jgi:hypothetical protein
MEQKRFMIDCHYDRFCPISIEDRGFAPIGFVSLRQHPHKLESGGTLYGDTGIQIK